MPDKRKQIQQGRNKQAFVFLLMVVRHFESFNKKDLEVYIALCRTSNGAFSQK